MRLLHTSDWHLGRTLHGASLIEHQRAFLTWLQHLAVREHVDAVLVAGDVYDRAVPPTDAVALLDEALAGFVAAGVPVVISSGNHDSAIRLGFAAAVQRAAGVHLRTSLEALTDPVVLHDGAGPVGLYAIPYLLPDAAMADLACERSHTAVLRAAVERVLVDARSRGLARTVVLAHAFVTGGHGCESERDISVGGIGDAPADVFDGVTYAALGHLHGAQRIAPRVRYSGSPLAFSFSEARHTKSVTIVDLAADGSVVTEAVPAPVPRPLREVRGTLADLLALDDPGLADAWVKAVVTDTRRPHAPMERLRQRWPHVLLLEFAPEGAGRPSAEPVRVAEASDPVEICEQFLAWVDSTLPDRRYSDELRLAVDAVRRLEASA